MALGYTGAAGLNAGYQSLEQILAGRIAAQLEQQKLAEQAQQRAIENQRANEELQLRRDEFGLRKSQSEKPAPSHGPYVVNGALVNEQGGVLYSAPEKPATAPKTGVHVVGGNLVDDTGHVLFTAPKDPAKPEKTQDEILREYEEKKKIDAKYTGTRPSLGAEKTALNYFNRMLQAERDARAVEDQVGGWDAALPDVPGVPNMLENFLHSAAGQKYQQAQRAYTEARLRKESGAAIPQSEFDTDRRTNFKVAGDAPDLMKQKRGMRLETMRGIGNSAGRALQEFYGDDATLESLLAEFADKPTSGGAAQGGSQAGPKVGERRTINGVPATWDGKGWLPAR